MNNFSFSFWTDRMIIIAINEYRKFGEAGKNDWERKRHGALLKEAANRRLRV